MRRPITGLVEGLVMILDNMCPVGSRNGRGCNHCCNEIACAARLRVPRLGFSRSKMDAEDCAIAHLRYPVEDVCSEWGCEDCICGPLHRDKLKQFLEELKKL